MADVDLRLKLAQIDLQLAADRDGERQKIPVVSWQISVTLLDCVAAIFAAGAAFTAGIIVLLK